MLSFFMNYYTLLNFGVLSSCGFRWKRRGKKTSYIYFRLGRHKRKLFKVSAMHATTNLAWNCPRINRSVRCVTVVQNADRISVAHVVWCATAILQSRRSYRSVVPRSLPKPGFLEAVPSLDLAAINHAQWMPSC